MSKSIINITCFIFGIFIFTSGFAEVRQPAVAGSFYPADSAQLAKMVSDHLNNVKDLPEIDGELIALLVPHAGLIYSGQIAAYSYKLLGKTKINNVILCGPSHRFRFNGLSVYGPGVIWKTPLGQVVCNDILCNRLINSNQSIKATKEAHLQEHCLEVQLPYLQTVLPEAQIVPVIMGYPDNKTVDILAEALFSVVKDDHAIMIASTDWQHYRPASEGWVKDSLGLDCLKNLDPDKLNEYLQDGKVEMCGGGAAVAILRAAMKLGADKVKILEYGDSGDITGDKSSVVSYTAAAIYKSTTNPDKADKTEKNDEQKAENEKPESSNFQLSDEDKKQLLEIARQSIEIYLASGSYPDYDVPAHLRGLGAAFVTLEKKGELRGCIGHTIAIKPLYQTVSYCAIQAAVGDPRFPPVNIEELHQLDIEISVLTPLQKVFSFGEIKVGRDGLMIVSGNKRGLLLPQVATDYRWNRTEFLEHTCNKAGLPPDEYLSPNVDIFKFQALIFNEKEILKK